MAPAIIAISKPPYSARASAAASAAGGAGGGAREDRALAGEAGVVEAGAAADERVEREAGELVGDERGGGGVADAHLAEGDRVPVAVGAEGAALARARGRARPAVIAGSARALRVPGPMRRESRSGCSIGAPATPASTTRSAAPTERAKTLAAAPPARKFSEHLPGDRLRVGGDALGGEAVVGGEDGQLAGPHPRRERAAGAGDLGGEVLDAAEGAERLGLAVDPAAERRLQSLVPCHRRSPAARDRMASGRRGRAQAGGQRRPPTSSRWASRSSGSSKTRIAPAWRSSSTP